MEYTALVNSTEGILAVLCSVCMGSFYITKKFPKIFNYVPAIIWVYAVPMVLTNVGVIPPQSEIYQVLKKYAIPMFIAIMLLEVNIKSSFSVAGRAIGVMLIASLGIVVGCVVSFGMFKGILGPEAWKGIGALAGSWTGGTGNMAAVGAGVGIKGATMGLAILTDSIVAMVWIPILILSS